MTLHHTGQDHNGYSTPFADHLGEKDIHFRQV